MEKPAKESIAAIPKLSLFWRDKRKKASRKSCEIHNKEVLRLVKYREKTRVRVIEKKMKRKTFDKAK
jgi:hypothetical protein